MCIMICGIISMHIGPMLSNALVNAGMISFEKIASTNPRELELVSKLVHVANMYMY